MDQVQKNRKKFREYFLENKREEFRLNDKKYLDLKTLGNYQVGSDKEGFYLYKDNNYVAHIEGTFDKYNGKKSLFISTSYSSERGALKVLHEYALKKVHYTISDQILSDDAKKYYIKLSKDFNTYLIDYKENIIDEPINSDTLSRFQIVVAR